MQVTAKRMTVKDAAIVLAMDPETIRQKIRQGKLSAMTNGGSTGPGVRKFLDPLEVDAYARGGEPAAEAYRAERDRKAVPVRRGRGGRS